MLAIARALVREPKILLLDEPFEGLAPIIVRDLLATCRELAEAGQTILLVEQNISAAMTLADRVYIINNGHIVEALTAQPCATSRKCCTAISAFRASPAPLRADLGGIGKLTNGRNESTLRSAMRPMRTLGAQIMTLTDISTAAPAPRRLSCRTSRRARSPVALPPRRGYSGTIPRGRRYERPACHNAERCRKNARDLRHPTRGICAAQERPL